MKSFINNLLNKRWLRATVILGILLFLFLSFSQTGLAARELENQYPKIPLPNVGVGNVQFNEGPYSLNDIAERVKEPFKSQISPFSGLIYYFFAFAVSIVGLVAFGTIIYTGVMFVMSGARPEMRARAMTRLRNTIFGIALLLGSVIILNTINPELTILNVPPVDWKKLSFTLPSPYVYETKGPALIGPGGLEIHLFDFWVLVPPSTLEPGASVTKQGSAFVAQGGTVNLGWELPDNARDCVTRSSPQKLGRWGDNVSLRSLTSANSYDLTVPTNQKPAPYALQIACGGSFTSKDVTITVIPAGTTTETAQEDLREIETIQQDPNTRRVFWEFASGTKFNYNVKDEGGKFSKCNIKLNGVLQPVGTLNSPKQPYSFNAAGTSTIDVSLELGLFPRIGETYTLSCYYTDFASPFEYDVRI